MHSESEHNDKEPRLQHLEARKTITFERIYDTYKDDLYAYCRSLVKSDAYAEEIVQDVFVKLWMNFENLKPELSIRALLFTMIRNASFNFLKKAARTKELHDEVFRNELTPANLTGRSLVEEDYKVLQQEAIALLPPKRKAIFLMSRQREMSYDDISQELNISVSTVKTQMSLALASIREFLRLHTDLTLFVIWLFGALSL